MDPDEGIGYTWPIRCAILPPMIEVYSMSSYSVLSYMVAVLSTQATMLKVGFGSPASNDQIVKDTVATLENLSLQGGRLAR